jgi:hypothetical protein
MAKVKLNPVLEQLWGQTEDEIVVLASDDFDVMNVDVVIADGDGNAVESGAATETPPDSGRWVYAAGADVAAGTTSARALMRVAVTASDRPGGTGQAEAEKTM